MVDLMEEFNGWLELLHAKERDEILGIMKLEIIEAIPALIKYLKN